VSTINRKLFHRWHKLFTIYVLYQMQFFISKECNIEVGVSHLCCIWDALTLGLCKYNRIINETRKNATLSLDTPTFTIHFFRQTLK
jgi:hypothetical protein